MYNECLFVLNKIDKMMTDSPEYAEGMVNTFCIVQKWPLGLIGLLERNILGRRWQAPSKLIHILIVKLN